MHFLFFFFGFLPPVLERFFFTPRNAEVARARAVNGLNSGHPKQVGQSHSWVQKTMVGLHPRILNMDTQNGHI